MDVNDITTCDDEHITNANISATPSFVQMEVNRNYEISKTYPYIIRDKLTHQPISITTNDDGELVCTLSYGKDMMKNKQWEVKLIVARQWLKRPHTLSTIIYKDNDKSNVNVTNLSYVPLTNAITNTITDLSTAATNASLIAHDTQQRVFEYIPTLPTTTIPITQYNDAVITEGHYYYDYFNDRIIKMQTRSNERTFRYNRAHTLTILTADAKALRVSDAKLREHMRRLIATNPSLITTNNNTTNNSSTTNASN